MIDIANALSGAGFQVSLITGRLVQRTTQLSHLIKQERIIKYRRSNSIVRLVSWFVALFQILFLIWFKYSGSHLFIVSNPPLAPLIPLACKNSYSLLIFDVYVEKPEEFPLLNPRSLVVKLWKKAHSKVFAGADNIFTLTEGMQDTIEKYLGGRKCEVIPLWTDNDFLKPMPPSNNRFITEKNLQNKFIVLYSGNIGVSSGVEYLIDAASIIDNEQIVFVIIGDGIRKKAIINKVKKLGLTNCLILPWQEPQILPYSLASANLAVVGLSSKSSKRAIPSKLYNYLSVGAPILCLANPDSDLGKFVFREEIGKCFNPSEVNEIVDYILQIYSNPTEAERLGINSLNASKIFTKNNVNKYLLAITKTINC